MLSVTVHVHSLWQKAKVSSTKKHTSTLKSNLIHQPGKSGFFFCLQRKKKAVSIFLIYSAVVYDSIVMEICRKNLVHFLYNGCCPKCTHFTYIVWSESHHIVIEVGFEHRLQYPFECLLYQLIFVAVDIQRAGFPLSFGISTLLAGWGLYDFRFNLSTNAFTFASRLSPYISFVTPSILLLYLDVSPQSFNCFTGTIRASGYTVSHLPSSLSGCLAYHILH